MTETEHSTNGERQLNINDKVTTLYGLMLVELEGARHMSNIRLSDGRPDTYALGRAGAYELVVNAMESRWPSLKRFRPIYERGPE